MGNECWGEDCGEGVGLVFKIFWVRRVFLLILNFSNYNRRVFVIFGYKFFMIINWGNLEYVEF